LKIIQRGSCQINYENICPMLNNIEMKNYRRNSTTCSFYLKKLTKMQLGTIIIKKILGTIPGLNIQTSNISDSQVYESRIMYKEYYCILMD